MTDWAINWDRTRDERLHLRREVNELLVRQPNVASTTFFGSLASSEPDGYPADDLSDIDIRVAVQGCSDLDLYRDLNDLLAPMGEVLLYSAFMSSASYTGSFMFEGYSPFWHVDIVCYSDRHVYEPQALEQVRVERAFAAWLSALKRFVRAGSFLDYFVELVPDANTEIHHDPRALFSTLLDSWRAHDGDDVRYAIGRDTLRHLFGSDAI